MKLLLSLALVLGLALPCQARPHPLQKLKGLRARVVKVVRKAPAPKLISQTRRKLSAAEVAELSKPCKCGPACKCAPCGCK